jgi:hypothetical protein
MTTRRSSSVDPASPEGRCSVPCSPPDDRRTRSMPARRRTRHRPGLPASNDAMSPRRQTLHCTPLTAAGSRRCARPRWLWLHTACHPETEQKGLKARRPCPPSRVRARCHLPAGAGLEMRARRGPSMPARGRTPASRGRRRPEATVHAMMRRWRGVLTCNFSPRFSYLGSAARRFLVT